MEHSFFRTEKNVTYRTEKNGVPNPDKNGVVQYDRKLCSVVDPKLFIPYPDPALNYPSSGSEQTFRIHADPDSDPQH